MTPVFVYYNETQITTSDFVKTVTDFYKLGLINYFLKSVRVC